MVILRWYSALWWLCRGRMPPWSFLYMTWNDDERKWNLGARSCDHGVVSCGNSILNLTFVSFLLFCRGGFGTFYRRKNLYFTWNSTQCVKTAFACWWVLFAWCWVLFAWCHKMRTAIISRRYFDNCFVLWCPCSHSSPVHGRAIIFVETSDENYRGSCGTKIEIALIPNCQIYYTYLQIITRNNRHRIPRASHPGSFWV